MGRSQRSSLADDLFALLSITPIWFGPILAVIAFLVFRYVVPSFFPASQGAVYPGTLIRPLSSMLSWIAAGFILCLWAIAEVYKLSNRRLFDRNRDIQKIRELSWHEFERLMTEAYRRQGYLAEHVGTTAGDGGIDIHLAGKDQRLLVQCKQWRTYKVGVGPVRELLGVVVSEGADRGILVTSGRFTPEAIRFAERNKRLELIDGNRLASMVGEIRGAKSTADATLDSLPPETAPPCPSCRRPMVLRTARRGRGAGSQFWGCMAYPACKGTRPFESK